MIKHCYLSIRFLPIFDLLKQAGFCRVCGRISSGLSPGVIRFGLASEASCDWENNAMVFIIVHCDNHHFNNFSSHTII